MSACAHVDNGTGEVKVRFEGRVLDSRGLAVADAWVSVLGWQTVTDQDGRWQQEQVIDCGRAAGDERLVVDAEGFQPASRDLASAHPDWKKRCGPNLVLSFETTLNPDSPEARQNREASKFKPREPSTIPWPTPKPPKPNVKKNSRAQELSKEL